MARSISVAFLSFCLACVITVDDCQARGGRGGGGMRGGGGGGFSGGASRGYSGGASRGYSSGGSRGYSSGGSRGYSSGGSRGYSGGGSRGYSGGAGMSSGGFNTSRMPSGGSGARTSRTSSGNFGSNNLGSSNLGGRNPGAGNFGQNPLRSNSGFNQSRSQATPSRDQLGSFLGLPSDGGMQHLSSGTRSTQRSENFSDNFDVNYGTKEGDRGGTAAGISVSGPGGNTTYRAGAQGAYGGTAAARGVSGAEGNSAFRAGAQGAYGGRAAAGGVSGAEGNSAFRAGARGVYGGTAAARGASGADGGRAVQGAAVGPGGRAVAGGAAENRYGAAAARGVAVGPRGAAAGFARVTPSGRYTTAAAVRTNYNHWGYYNRGWYAQYPGAWIAAGWTAATLWAPCTWSTAATYCDFTDVPPVYYDYGNNVTYSDDSVYINGDNVGTTEEYYDQASEIASTGAEAEADPQGEWLPLGVFALSQPDQPKSDITIQLSVNHDGVIRGNWTDSKSDTNQVIKGSIDKETQKAAFTIGDDNTTVIETGIYNLTKDEAPVLIHRGSDQTEQWLLVRVDPADNPEGTPAN